MMPSTRAGRICQSRSGDLDPFAVCIAHQVSPRLQAVQQLDGEEGMAGSLPVERIAKGTIQPVGFAIDERVHKAAAVGLVEPHVDLAKGALQFVDQRVQRMSFAAATQGDFGRTVDADQQDALPLEMTTQMEEQADRTGIHPLQIVDDQQQRLATGQALQNTCVLGEEVALVHVSRPGVHAGDGR